MDVTLEVSNILVRAYEFAKERNDEYITAEHIVYELSNEKRFIDSINVSGENLKLLQDNIVKYLDEFIEKTKDTLPIESYNFQQLILLANQQAIYADRESISMEHFISSIYQLEDSFAAYYLDQLIDKTSLLKELCHGENNKENDNTPKEENEFIDDDNVKEYDNHHGEEKKSKASILTNLNGFVAMENLDPLIGREDIIDRTIQILCRRTKNNPIHIGEPGVGKTAITLGLAALINEGKVPQKLKDAEVFLLDLGAALAGAKYRGDFEERIKKALEGLKSHSNAIVYIDEIHNIVGAGSTNGGVMDASNLLKPYLLSGKIKFIGATTFDEYKKHFQKDKALSRRFGVIEVKEPTVEETIEILKGLKENYEKHHGVRYTEEAIKSAVTLSHKYINDKFLPDKAIDVIDEAGSYISMREHNNEVVTDNEIKTKNKAKIENHDSIQNQHEILSKEEIDSEQPVENKQKLENKDTIDKYNTEALEERKLVTIDEKIIEEVVSKICNIPKQTVETDEKDSLKKLEEELKSKVFGQDVAIEDIVKAIKISRAGLKSEDKPVASMLFVGPTGVGKTEIARSLANTLGVKLVRFDMSEYSEKHAASKLIGAPPGYVGFEEGGLLIDSVKKNPYSVLLLDEIEKAHSDILNVLLQVMDYATLTDNQGRKADFRNTIIIMTSNAGAKEVGKKLMGFGERTVESHAIMDAVKKVFTPEFRNRLDKIVVFNHIDEAMSLKIVDKEISIFNKQLSKKNITIEFSEEAIKFIAKKGTSPEYGAREIQRIINSEIKSLLIDEILFGKLENGGVGKIDIENEKYILR